MSKKEAENTQYSDAASSAMRRAPDEGLSKAAKRRQRDSSSVMPHGTRARLGRKAQTRVKTVVILAKQVESLLRTGMAMRSVSHSAKVHLGLALRHVRISAPIYVSTA